MLDVVALGELLIDFMQKSVDEDNYPTMQANPGGAPANFLGALSKYGKRTAFLGKVGDDTFGHLLVGTLKKAGIDTRGIVVDPSYFTTLAFVTCDESGERSFAFSRKPGADTMLCYKELDLSLIDEAKVLHFGTLSLTCEPVCSTTRQAVAYAKNAGKLITFDPNLRLPLWDTPEAAREQMLWGLQQADIVKISCEEISFLYDSDPEDGARKILDECKVRLVVLTLGAEGSVLLTKQARGAAKCPKVTAVDTTGAGDICGGSALSCLLNIEKPFEELNAKELADIAEFASTAASLSTQTIGGIPSIPELDYVYETMRKQAK